MSISNEPVKVPESVQDARFIKSKDGTLARVVVLPTAPSHSAITSDERMMLDMSDHIEYLELMLTAAGVPFNPYGLPPAPVNKEQGN